MTTSQPVAASRPFHQPQPLSLMLLALIVFGYLAIGTLYAVKTPAWQVPDEPAQYNYLAQLGRSGCCLKMAPGDWDNTYLEAIKAAKFAPASLNRFDAIRYENHQPPLYYLLLLPVYQASGGNLIALRVVSMVLGAGVIVLAWAAVWLVFPAQPWLSLSTAAFIAFLPQHVAMMAAVENDSLAELLVAAALWAAVLYVQGSRRVHPLTLGLLLGAAFVTKLTVYLPVAGVIGLAVLLRARRSRQLKMIPVLVRQSAWVLIPALIIGGVWWARNVVTYGDVADFMAQKTHDTVVVGQPRTADYIAQRGGLATWLSDGIQTTFHSFWGQFGWMGVPMPMPFYTALLVISGLIIVGAVLALVCWRHALSAVQWEALLLFGASAILAFAAFAGYNIKFVQFQGRYLYPGLIGIGLFVAIGLVGWTVRLPARYARVRWLTVAVVCLLAALDIYALYRFVIPILSL